MPSATVDHDVLIVGAGPAGIAAATRLRRAGIEDSRWHDLRCTCASWHVRDGTPLHALQDSETGKA